MIQGKPINSTFIVPSQEGGALEPSISPEAIDLKPRPIIPGEGVRAYQDRSRELAEEASRLALSSTPTFMETVQEFAARPGPESAPELHILSSVGREIARLRHQKAQELASTASGFERLTKYSALKDDDLVNRIAAELLEDEARIGGNLFTSQAKNDEVSFYFENANGQDEYFFTRRHLLEKNPYEVLRFIVLPNVVLKDYGGPEPIALEGKELRALVQSAQLAFVKINQKFHQPQIPGRHRAQ